MKKDFGRSLIHPLFRAGLTLKLGQVAQGLLLVSFANFCFTKLLQQWLQADIVCRDEHLGLEQLF